MVLPFAFQVNDIAYHITNLNIICGCISSILSIQVKESHSNIIQIHVSRIRFQLRQGDIVECQLRFGLQAVSRNGDTTLRRGDGYGRTGGNHRQCRQKLQRGT